MHKYLIRFLKTACYICWSLIFFYSCKKEIIDQTIDLSKQAVSIFDLVEDIQFLRLGDTLHEESLFSKIQNVYLLDSFIVCGQNGISFPDHGQFIYFNNNGQFLHRFNANEVVKEGMIYSSGFFADNKVNYIPDKIRHLIFKINHQGELVEALPNINKAPLLLPMTNDITLYSYNRDKPKSLLDDEYYDFFLYSEKQHKIIEKGVTEVPEYYRMEYGDIQFIKSPHSNTLYHCTVRDPSYIIYEMTPEKILEIDRLKFAEGMVNTERLFKDNNNWPSASYYREEDVVTDVYAIQRVDDEIFCMIDRGFGTNYLVRKNIKTGESGSVQIDWHGMVARDYVLRDKVLAYTQDEYLVLFTPATTFKPFYDRNKNMLQPYLKNDFTNFAYSDNDVLIFLKFKPEFYDM